jgi:hypothetical protein
VRVSTVEQIPLGKVARYSASVNTGRADRLIL